MELYWTALIELIWGKERILEVYLNVAEMGYGIYGIEAASQKYFHSPAKEISLYDGAALAVCMPEPLKRTPVTVWNTEQVKLRKLLCQLKKGKRATFLSHPLAVYLSGRIPSVISCSTH